MKRSKLYRSRLEKVDRTKYYSLEEAVAVLKSMPSSTKFDETVEVSFRLGIDPKQSDQMVRGSISYIHNNRSIAKQSQTMRNPTTEKEPNYG